ncbi:MAG TPA: FAD binding domain-containing protein [Syntrophorhabdales bacterium]|nr:FAD binding domain-containing protein [Syntrophorhabdales bacterium]
MKSFTHYDARTIEAAVKLLKNYKGKAKINAGGTDLLGALKQGSLREYPEAIINIKDVGRLDAIRQDKTGVRIGALTKLADLVSSPIVKESYPVLADAARSVATPLVRNMCTIGGNLAQDVRCWYYRYPQQIGGPITCLRKGGKICNALMGDNRYHSLFGAAPLDVYPCSSGCPAHIDIPSYLAMVRAGDMMAAARRMLDFNPIPAITGRVCPIFCEPECNRSAFDEPVAIRCVERSVGDYILARAGKFFAPPEHESGRTIAIIGSGPAGMSAAYYLRRSGHRVWVFDRLPEAGGMLLYSIPSSRLPKDVVRKQVRALEGMGVKFQVGITVGRNVPLAELMSRFAAVFVAGGSWKERPLGIKGEQIALSGLAFLNRTNAGDTIIPGKKVAIVGGGNVAMDVARTLRRLGAEPVVLYRRTRDEMPAFKDEVKKATEEGIEFQFLTLPIEAAKNNGSIQLKCIRMKLGALDASGRPQPVPIPGSEFTATFDALIKAIGEEPDPALLPAELMAKARKAGPVVRLGKHLFAGGDLVTGPSTVVQAVTAGREAAGLIESALKSGKAATRERETERAFSEPSFVTTARVSIPEAPVAERVKGLEIEDIRGLSMSDIEAEARRCFNCGCLAVGPSDIGVALIALGATIVTTKRSIDAETFFSTSVTDATVLNPDEIITEIRIPKPADGTRQKYLKFTLREPVDFAIVSVASMISLKDGRCEEARIVLGAVAPTPVRAFAAEQILKGKPISEAIAAEAAEAALAEAKPLNMNAYKTEIAKALVKRAILGQPAS